jgi:hypothetical protein
MLENYLPLLGFRNIWNEQETVSGDIDLFLMENTTYRFSDGR